MTMLRAKLFFRRPKLSFDYSWDTVFKVTAHTWAIFFQKIEFFDILIFCSTSYYKKNDRPVQKLQLFIIWPMLAFLRSFLETH